MNLEIVAIFLPLPLIIPFVSVEEVSGPILKLWKVSRMDMGAYMCIAR